MAPKLAETPWHDGDVLLFAGLEVSLPDDPVVGRPDNVVYEVLSLASDDPYQRERGHAGPAGIEIGAVRAVAVVDEMAGCAGARAVSRGEGGRPKVSTSRARGHAAVAHTAGGDAVM